MGSPTSHRYNPKVYAPDPENDYAGTPYWVEVMTPGVKGFRGIFPTAAEDFATPYVEDGEDPDGWDLI